MKLKIINGSLSFASSMVPVWRNPDDEAYFATGTYAYNQNGIGCSTNKMLTEIEFNRVVVPRVNAVEDVNVSYIVFATKLIKTNSASGQVIAELYSGFGSQQTILGEGTMSLSAGEQMVTININKANVPTAAIVEVLFYNGSSKVGLPTKANKDVNTSLIAMSTSTGKTLRTATWTTTTPSYSTLCPILYLV